MFLLRFFFICSITGGNTGIGYETALDLATRGAEIIMGCRNIKKANDAALKIRVAGNHPVHVLSLDLSSLASVRKFAAEVRKITSKVDILVNNAGITRDAPFHKMTKEQWSQVIGTNLTGVFNMTHPIWPGMRERKFGRIITISSINGQNILLCLQQTGFLLPTVKRG